MARREVSSALTLFGGAANGAELTSIKAAINGGMLCEKRSG